MCFGPAFGGLVLTCCLLYGSQCFAELKLKFIAAHWNARRLLCKRPELLSITHKSNSDHDAQFYVG